MTKSSAAFQVKQRSRYRLIVGDPVMGSAPGPEEKSILDDLMNEPNHIFVNLNWVTEVHDIWIDLFDTLRKRLAHSNKKLLFIRADPSRGKGVDQKFEKDEILNTLEEALSAIQSGESKINWGPVFIKAVVQSTIHTLSVQAHVKCERRPVQNTEDDCNRLQGEINSLINVLGDYSQFLVILSFPERTFLNIMSSMLSESFVEVNDEIIHGASEIVNMIYAGAKSKLNALSAEIKPSAPVFIRGNQFPGENPSEETILLTQDLNKGKNVIIPFQSGAGEFYLRVWLTPEIIEQIRQS